jgi:hypothetical protein
MTFRSILRNTNSDYKIPHSTTYKSTIITTLQSLATTKASDNVLVLSADETNLLANMLKRPNETDDTTSQPTGISFPLSDIIGCVVEFKDSGEVTIVVAFSCNDWLVCVTDSGVVLVFAVLSVII